MFTTDRLPDKANGALNIQLKCLVDHNYSYSDFSFGGYKCVGLLGCFVLPTDDRNKRVEEADLYRRHFTYAESGEKDDDIPFSIIMKTKLSWEDADSGSDVEMPADDWKKRVEEADHYRRHFAKKVVKRTMRFSLGRLDHVGRLFGMFARMMIRTVKW